MRAPKYSIILAAGKGTRMQSANLHKVCFPIDGKAAIDYSGTELARVEVPEWVVGQPEALNLVHAAVFEQCRFNNGYPYVLTRADEQAVIAEEEREVLEAMIIRAMARHGLPLPELSRKAQQKQVARWRRPL